MASGVIMRARTAMVPPGSVDAPDWLQLVAADSSSPAKTKRIACGQVSYGKGLCLDLTGAKINARLPHERAFKNTF